MSPESRLTRTGSASGSAREWRELAASTSIWSLILVGAATLILLVPALWNGSPFYYWDSVDYIDFSFTWQVPVYRTAPYGLFVGIGHLSGSVWTVAVVQAAMAAYVLYEAVAVFGPSPSDPWRQRRVYLSLLLVLAAFTALPWDAGELMPDIFTGIVALVFAALAFGAERLGRARRLALVQMLVTAIAVHTSHLALAAGLLLSLAGARVVLRRRWPRLRPRLGLPTIAILASALMVVTIHWVALGRPFLTQPGSVVLLARLVQDGIAKRFLDDACPRGETYSLCAFRDEFPMEANAFLWGAGCISDQLGGWEALEPSAREILVKSLERYPWLHLEAAVRMTAQQLAMLETGDGMVSSLDWVLSDKLKKDFPRDWLAYQHSRQHQGIDFVPINALHLPVAVAALPLLVLALWLTWRRCDPLGFGLVLIVVLAVMGNAFICGALSNPNHRYQARIVWAAVAALGIAGARLSSVSLGAAARHSTRLAGSPTSVRPGMADVSAP